MCTGSGVRVVLDVVRVSCLGGKGVAAGMAGTCEGEWENQTHGLPSAFAFRTHRIVIEGVPPLAHENKPSGGARGAQQPQFPAVGGWLEWRPFCAA